MALDPVCKVEITAHNSIIDSMLNSLQSLSVIQIDPHGIERWESDKECIQKTGKYIDELKHELATVNKAISFLDAHAPRLSILQKLSMQPDEFTNDELKRFARKKDVQAVKEKALGAEERLAEVESGIKDYTSKVIELAPIINFRALLSSIDTAGTVRTVIARLETEAFQKLYAGFDEDLVVVEEISGGEITVSRIGDSSPLNDEQQEEFSAIYKPERAVYFCIIYHSDAAQVVEQLEKQYRFEPLSFPDMDQTPAEAIKSFLAEILKLKAKKDTLLSQASDIASEIRILRVYSDYLETELEKENAKERFFYTHEVSVIHGWLKKRDLPLLEKTVGAFKEAHITQIEKKEDELPPVAYRNNSLVSPFEIIVNLYSPPNHREVDPTPILAPFYALFFGICLTEAGYGLVIAIISLIGMSLIKTNNGFKKFLKLFLILGVSTFVIGALIGTVFGINFDLLPEKLAWLREARYKIMLFDSSKDVLTFFALALSLGVLHLITGYIIKIYMLIRDGEWIEAVCDHLPWIFLLLAPVPKVLQKFMPGARGTLDLLFYVLLALWAGIILLFSERSSLNPIKRIGKGLFTLYGVSGVLGDILSYSRLLALGLATGVIAGVMDTLAGMVKQIPIVGIVGFVGVLIVGHLFNLFISGLSAFVHSIRLQFMEFFTKFYTGEGELLSTFSEKRKYTQVKLQKN